MKLRPLLGRAGQGMSTTVANQRVGSIFSALLSCAREIRKVHCAVPLAAEGQAIAPAPVSSWNVKAAFDAKHPVQENCAAST